MKLCRFELHDDPGTVRSGIYHENRVYETDGQHAIGVHDPGRVRFLPPVGAPRTLRFVQPTPLPAPYDLVRVYGDPHALEGLDAQLEAPAGESELDIEVRLGCIVKDDAESLEAAEAASFILGYLPAATLLPRRAAREAVNAGTSWYVVREDVWAVGGLLSTAEEWDGAIGPDRAPDLVVDVNGQEVFADKVTLSPSIGDIAARLSAGATLRSGDLVLSAPLALPPIAETRLGRWLRPGDRVAVRERTLGRLAFQVV